MARILLAVLCLALLPLQTGAQQARVPQSRAEVQLSFVPLVKEATPAVVNIYARRVVKERTSPFMNDPFFQGLFRDFGTVRPRVQNSLGSGVILSEDGIVVSNYHVVAQATDIRVVLNDRREFDAKVLLSDEESDLAVLRLEKAGKMPFLNLRDSDSVEVGELTLAIGNPFGVGQTVSSGIVSGLARSGTATGSARGYFIQTDAPINPGNSGGALIDTQGRLIGINTSILTRSGGSNGIGFAIPANLVAQFVDQAREGNQNFERPWAGMSGQPVDADIAASLGLGRPGGMLISQLHPLSPFGDAGFEAGDVVLAVDDEPVNTPAEMLFRLSVTGIGETATIERFRRGKRREVDVKMIAAPDTPPRDTRVLDGNSALPGLRISTVNPAVIGEYGLPLSAQGALVEEPGQYGARIGLRKGDVILEINATQIATSNDVTRALRDRVGMVSMAVQRGAERFVTRFRL
ncbi:MAG: trypsin-like peptidase domain-containing protein [Sediminimonas sp.]|uniref:trypsin-like peptidase domain-containing protein n=1 Tax=Sediminimonas sp. TaxID=2823379 RepID=UPI002870167E|nr:trypsin-like peptidase domain-containing protein [Sediminimonas sp.]MDR9484820.1 trypsin-like peptidase domain-containing protein [Sediminimonas sp.]